MVNAEFKQLEKIIETDRVPSKKNSTFEKIPVTLSQYIGKLLIFN